MMGVMTDDDDGELPYAVHETFLGGMLGRLVSRHETILEALAVATEPSKIATEPSKIRAIVHKRQIVWPPPTDLERP
jgi:hypothetical protein